jgi:hypothetical protein
MCHTLNVDLILFRSFDRTKANLNEEVTREIFASKSFKIILGNDLELQTSIRSRLLLRIAQIKTSVGVNGKP